MARFERHIFTCINERDEADARGCCAHRGGLDIAAWLKAEGKTRNWKGRIRANKAGCLDACEFGPVLVVYPEGVWYSPQTREDVKRICDEHIDGGKVVDELLTPGLNG